MASTFAVTRKHLIFGICLPLALLIGYLLADPQDPVTRLFVFGTIVCLSIPLMMSWYHPIVVLCWHMGAAPAIPGRPELWSIVAFMGLVVIIINRAMSEDSRVTPVPRLTWPILALAATVILTAMATGGVGLGMLRSGTVGGKNYFYLIAAMVGFFVLGSKPIPPHRAPLYIALFFLPGLLAAAPRVAQIFGSAGDFVYFLFPPDFDESEPTALSAFSDIVRLRGVSVAATVAFFWVLARVGARGVFDWKRPYWAGLTGLLLFGATLGGFRSIAILMVLTLIMLFFLEKLWRTRAMMFVLCIIFVGGGFLIGFADKLPFAVQRTLSFLPLDLDPMVKMSAETSTDWRIEMWREAVKLVPEYFFKGKGYTTTADDMYMSSFSISAGYWRNWEWALTAGDYHNGPLSLLIPFGIYGLLGFLWLAIAGGIFLYRNYRDSAPELKQINTLLFGLFIVRVVFFLTIYGAIARDLYLFTGILGLSVALNVPGKSAEATQPAPELEPEPTPQI